ncbi:hypothetical protein EDB92DRAFT_1814483 [Lactarius akahatsu]|uniref:Uncharacterized protein n=1 Tax=Lactarius akahatsu TaxID=416441 RepID=A0AAD4LK54_9AGAM|nr:hypothetical protein EDB92DRAFT_1814483 [Lactarius akahatsu]
MPRQSSLPPRDIFGKFIRKPETASTDTLPKTPLRQPEPSTSNSTLDITEAFTPNYEITPRPNHAQSIPGSFSPQTEPSPQSSIPFLTLVAQSYKLFVPPSLIPVLKSTTLPLTSRTPATSSNLPSPAQLTSLIVSTKARSLSNPQKPLPPPPTSSVTASSALTPNLASISSSSLSLNTPSTVSSIAPSTAVLSPSSTPNPTTTVSSSAPTYTTSSIAPALTTAPAAPVHPPAVIAAPRHMAAIPATSPVAMPAACSHNAPYFSGHIGDPLDDFLWEYEELATSRNLTPQEKVETITCYIPTDLQDLWKLLNSYTTPNWALFWLSIEGI